jgi:hypothetical protein
MGYGFLDRLPVARQAPFFCPIDLSQDLRGRSLLSCLEISGGIQLVFCLDMGRCPVNEKNYRFAALSP